MRWGHPRRIGRTALAMSLAVTWACVANAGDIDRNCVRIQFFQDPGCPECLRVEEEILPQVRLAYEGFYRLEDLDMTEESNVLALVRYQKAMGITGNEPVCMVFDGRTALNGLATIRAGWRRVMDESIEDRLASGETESADVPSLRDGAGGHESDGPQVLRERVRSFTLAMIVINGLADGVNPCAMTTLVFLVSILTAKGLGTGRVWILGASFCVGTWLIYTGLGLGLLHFLRRAPFFGVWRDCFDWGMFAALILLGVLSFRDAHRYAHTGRPGAVLLQLPDQLKKATHWAIRVALRSRFLAIAGFVMGAVVTALEAVCTGQMYVPTLALAVRSGARPVAALGYLLLYNVMFTVPLVFVFFLVWRGLGMERLRRWSVKNVVASKAVMGSLFLGMAALIVLSR